MHPVHRAEAQKLLDRYREAEDEYQTAMAESEADQIDLAAAAYEAHDDALAELAHEFAALMERLTHVVEEPDGHLHEIEQHAKVYLELDENERWKVAHVTLDGHPLDGLDGAQNGECLLTHEPGSSDRSDCIGMRERANRIDLPTGQELYELLGRALGRQAF